jgi:hypothetical protein
VVVAALVALAVLVVQVELVAVQVVLEQTQ